MVYTGDLILIYKHISVFNMVSLEEEMMESVLIVCAPHVMLEERWDNYQSFYFLAHDYLPLYMSLEMLRSELQGERYFCSP